MSAAAPKELTPIIVSTLSKAQGNVRRLSVVLRRTSCWSSSYVSTTSLHHRLVPMK